MKKTTSIRICEKTLAAGRRHAKANGQTFSSLVELTIRAVCRPVKTQMRKESPV